MLYRGDRGWRVYFKFIRLTGSKAEICNAILWAPADSTSELPQGQSAGNDRGAHAPIAYSREQLREEARGSTFERGYYSTLSYPNYKLQSTLS